MNIRERIESFWKGDKPDRIPYTIYFNEYNQVASNPLWKTLFDAGLGLTYNVSTTSSKMKNVHIRRQQYQEGGRQASKIIMETPVGEIYKTFIEGWPQKY